jgi:hypothetical protein
LSEQLNEAKVTFFYNRTDGGIQMAFNFETIKQVVQDYVTDVKNAMPIDHAFLYGSYANGTATEHNDKDLCFLR